MTTSTNHILEELDKFKKKYFLRLLIKGAVLFCTLIITLYLIFSGLEYIGHFNSTNRLLLLISFTLAFIFFIAKLVIIPIKHLINNKNELSNELTASKIGKLLPNISDKLLNTILSTDLILSFRRIDLTNL